MQKTEVSSQAKCPKPDPTQFVNVGPKWHSKKFLSCVTVFKSRSRVNSSGRKQQTWARNPASQGGWASSIY